MTADESSENELRQQIIDCCRRLTAANLNSGRAGNLSARWHRGASDGMLITPSAMHYEQMTPDDIVWMPLQQASEQVISDGDNRPSSEWRMHHDLYLADDKAINASTDAASTSRARAVLHVHSSYASSLSCLPRIQAQGIPAFHYMIAVAGGNTIRCASYQTFGTEALSEAMVDAIKDRNACLLANHGQIVKADNIEAAFDLAGEVEQLARMYWQALQLGEPVILTDAQMHEVHQAFAQYNYRKD